MRKTEKRGEGYKKETRDTMISSGMISSVRILGDLCVSDRVTWRGVALSANPPPHYSHTHTQTHWAFVFGFDPVMSPTSKSPPSLGAKCANYNSQQGKDVRLIFTFGNKVKSGGVVLLDWYGRHKGWFHCINIATISSRGNPAKTKTSSAVVQNSTLKGQ